MQQPLILNEIVLDLSKHNCSCHQQGLVE